MPQWQKVMATIVIVIGLSGCSYQRQMHLAPAQLPEQVYMSPQWVAKKQWRVAIFPFEEPEYAPNSGQAAASLLTRELLRRGVFKQLIAETRPVDQRIDSLVQLANQKDYDAIVIGRVEYLLAGSDFEASRVVQQLRVIGTGSGEPRLLWHARAEENVEPVPTNDYYVLRGLGRPAPVVETMLQRNAAKFAALLQWFPREAAAAAPAG